MSMNKSNFLSKNPDLKNKIASLELQLLHFIQKDIKYIEDLFGRGGIDVSVFIDPEIREIIKIIVEYYRRYNNLLVRQEFENHIDKLASDSKLTSSEHNKGADMST